ncbi:MAG: hypothetical protein AAF787_22400, partial [Chloroflexota bacterium]
LVITGGRWWLYGIALAGVIIASRDNWRYLLLILLWLLITPLVLLAVNATVMPVYQVRYVLGAFPAVAVMLAVGLATMHRFPIGRWIAPLLVAGIVLVQISGYGAMFPDKPDYQTAVATVAEQRNPLEPIITDMAHRDPVRYYSEQTNLTDGIAVDLSWRDHTPDEIDALVDGFASAEHVWLVQPVNVPKTWRTVTALQTQGRSVTHRANAQNMVFYRFSSSSAAESPLEFRYEDGQENTVATFIGQPATTLARDGSSDICVPLEMNFTRTENTSISLTVVRGFNEVITQWNGTPDDTEACFSVADAEPGDYYAYMTLYDTTTEARFAVMEHDVWWGWWIVSHHIAITADTAG